MNTEQARITIRYQIAHIKAIIATEDCDYKVQYERLHKLEQQLKDIENQE